MHHKKFPSCNGAVRFQVALNIMISGLSLACLYVVLKSDVRGTPIEFFRGEPKLNARDICIKGNIADRRAMTGCVRF